MMVLGRCLISGYLGPGGGIHLGLQGVAIY